MPPLERYIAHSCKRTLDSVDFSPGVAHAYGQLDVTGTPSRNDARQPSGFPAIDGCVDGVGGLLLARLREVAVDVNVNPNVEWPSFHETV